MDSPFRVKFWGTRGLISSPRKETAIFGGNTSSIQILHNNNLIIIDTGFGVSNLGETLMKRILYDHEPLLIHIFFTHFHWDHVQGLPFFHPIYFPTTELNLYSPLDPKDTKDNLDLLFDGSYSPFSGIDSMPSKINFKAVDSNLEIDGLKVDFAPLDHIDSNTGAFAYKLTNPEKQTLVVATDHEARDSKINQNLIDFSKQSDLLIHDGQFTCEEYKKHEGWGHSTIEQALSNAQASGAKHTILTHHHPSRNDSELLRIHKDLSDSERFKGQSFEFARENYIYHVVQKDDKP